MVRSGFTTKAIFCLILFCLFVPRSGSAETGDARDFFTISELTALYHQNEVPRDLSERLNQFLTVPFVENSTARSTLPILRSPQLGEFIRVAHWNIERGLEYDALEAAFDGEERLAAMLDIKRFPLRSPARLEILEQAALLRSADVIVLNEVDWGLKRSQYRNAAADLAARLGMNYAFGVEFIELSPVHLSLQKPPPGPKAAEISELTDLDASRYKGLHGTAILSRFPLENARLVPFKYQPYDWFGSEKQGISFVEKARRKLVKRVFHEDSFREVRRGGRTMLIADITDARFPSGRFTLVATHLENRTSPKHRQKQLAELLETIKPIRHPVVVAGDMNTSGTDMTPTSVRRELGKRFGRPEYWLKTGINFILGFGLFEDAVMASLTFGRNHGDPTVRHIPIIMPNEERKFFSTLKDFRFADGGAFDFRGEASRSSAGTGNTLGNSNERNEKGFVTTFRLERPVKFLGVFKLDWIFVKPVHLFDPSDYQGSYLFAPHFGRTLRAIHAIGEDRISDHSPMIVDLPLTEPAIGKEKEKTR